MSYEEKYQAWKEEKQRKKDESAKAAVKKSKPTLKKRKVPSHVERAVKRHRSMGGAERHTASARARLTPSVQVHYGGIVAKSVRSTNKSKQAKETPALKTAYKSKYVKEVGGRPLFTPPNSGLHPDRAENAVQSHPTTQCPYHPNSKEFVEAPMSRCSEAQGKTDKHVSFAHHPEIRHVTSSGIDFKRLVEEQKAGNASTGNASTAACVRAGRNERPLFRKEPYLARLERLAFILDEETECQQSAEQLAGHFLKIDDCWQSSKN
jgi:hypothetical protein